MTYKELMDRQNDEYKTLPIRYAFGDDQLNTILAEMGCSRKDVADIGGGAFCKKSDKPMIVSFFKRMRSEFQENMNDYNFAYSAFRYELANHKYCITLEYEDTLDALGLSFEDDIVGNTKRNRTLRQALSDATKDYMANYRL